MSESVARMGDGSSAGMGEFLAVVARWQGKCPESESQTNPIRVAQFPRQWHGPQYSYDFNLRRTVS